LFDLKRVKLTLENDALQGWEETQTAERQFELQQRPAQHCGSSGPRYVNRRVTSSLPVATDTAASRMKVSDNVTLVNLTPASRHRGRAKS
jgi:hypothetical protein